jgi:hypothetical protein
MSLDGSDRPLAGQPIESERGNENCREPKVGAQSDRKRGVDIEFVNTSSE